MGSSLSLLNHPWVSQNEKCILVNSSLPLIRAFWDPLISPFWSPQHKYGFPSKYLTSLVTEYLLVLWGVSLPQGGGAIYHYSILTGGSLYHGGQNTISHRLHQRTFHKWPRSTGWGNLSTSVLLKGREVCLALTSVIFVGMLLWVHRNSVHTCAVTTAHDAWLCILHVSNSRAIAQ